VIIAASPYQRDKNLGGAYNEFMERLKEGDWAALIDHDAMFTTTDWHQQIEDAIEEDDGGTGLFTCRTNRIGCGWQKAAGADPKIHDIAYHRSIGRALAKARWSQTMDVTRWEALPSRKPLSGVLMVISKIAWEDVGGFKNGFLTVDNDMHARMRRKNKAVKLLEGVYVYHWYRAEGRGS
jgi:GT2 family glycosyltransferase